ncbi:TPA: competence protein ComK [Bacillus luti]|nr:competence protein ComK [Bacillus luti]
MHNTNDIAISSSTMMLEPCKHPYYCTKIIDSSKDPIYSRQTPLQLIKTYCLTDVHSTYQGRRNAVQTNFKFKQNVPIPFNHKEYMCAFPTESPSSQNCIWLFYNHIHHIDFVKKNKKATIHFFNGTTVTIHIGCHKLEQQFMKTGFLLSRMNLQDLLKFKKPLITTFTTLK